MKFNVKTILRRTFKTLLALMGLLVCSFLGLALYNHYSDEDLSPEAAAYLSTPVIKVPPPETNAVFAVWGLRAAEGKDPHAEGLAYWKRAQLALKAKQALPEAPFDLPLPELPSCPSGAIDCQSWLLGQVNVDELVKKHRVALDRYRQLANYPSFVSPHTGTEVLNLPFAFQSFGLRRLWMLDLLHRLDKGDTPGVLAELTADIQIWIKSSADASFLIDKVVVNSFLQEDYRLLALASLKHPKIVKEHVAELNALLIPLPAHFFDWRGVMWGESSMNFHLLQEIAVEDSVGNRWLVDQDNKQNRWGSILWGISPWFYQEHTTQNSLYRQVLKTTAILELPPSKLVDLKDSEIFECGQISWSSLKNPLGKFLLCMGETDWSQYALSQLRIDAMRRLVVIQTQLLQHEPTEYAQIIQTLPPDLRNPQNGKPPRLDLKAHLLEFDWATRDGESKPLRVGLP